MNRTLVSLAMGAAAGAAATYVLLTDRNEAPAPWFATGPADSRGARAATAAAAAREEDRGPSARSAPVETTSLYRRAADAGAAEVESLIAAAAARPASIERDFTLGVLLARHAEIDALEAVELARELRVDGAALAPVYARWARTDPAGALEALGAADDRDAVEIGIALIEALGDDAGAIERVAAALGTTRDSRASARNGPVAMTPAMLDSRSTLMRIADRWAERHTADALARANEITDAGVRAIFETAAWREWGRREPEALVAHVAGLADATQQRALSSVMGELWRADPAQVLAMAPRFSRQFRFMVEQGALQRLSMQDPLAALRYAESVPAGMQRQQLLQTVARGYAHNDPEAALAWARARPPQDNLIVAVLGGIAELDAGRAFDVAVGLRGPNERMQALHNIVMRGVMGGAADAEMLAERVLALEDRSLRENVSTALLSMWASRSPDDATRWLLANSARMPPAVFQQVGQNLAAADPNAAAAHAVSLQGEARAAWIEGVAVGYARNDSRGAADWLGQFRGEPFYASAAVAVAGSLAQHDGAAAARLLDSIEGAAESPQSYGIGAMVAGTWALQDPRAAADWAANHRSEQMRSNALPNVIATWAGSDFENARQWTLRLPSSSLRDAGLTSLVAVSSADGTLDASVLSAFSSEASRQQAVLQAVTAAAYRDPAQAHRLVDYYIADPAMRAQAAQMIDSAAQHPPSTSFRPSIGIAQGIF